MEQKLHAVQTKCDKAEKVLKELSKAVSMVGDIDRDIGATLPPNTRTRSTATTTTLLRKRVHHSLDLTP